MAVISMKDLLEAGVHFGHQTRRWNPKMQEYIFGERSGIYVIDLKKTAKKLQEACKFVYNLASEGKIILFVGTKKQAQEIIKEEANRCNMFYVNKRWLGGMLTNFQTIKKSITKLKTLEKMATNGIMEKLPKKEVIRLSKEKVKLEKILMGIKEMNELPSAIFIVDAKKEIIAIQEAQKLNIPVIGLVDTNSDPDLVDYIIPGNDDALRSIKLITGIIAQAVVEGRALITEGSSDDSNIASVPENEETTSKEAE